MWGIVRDKYFLLCISAAFIMLLSSFLTESEDNGSGIVGTVGDLKESEKGFIFTLFTSSGGEQRCFSRKAVAEGMAVEVKGSLSNDGSIYFISSVTIL